MELKNLFLKLASTEEKKEYFLALEIGVKHIWVAVWQAGEKTEIVSIGSKKEWNGKTLESLIAASDASLASALESLPEEPNKTIFGLPETWVSGNKIVEPRKADLKALCQKLDLKPLGFVVTTEAIIQYLKILEGTPPSAILIYVGKEEILLTLVKTGKNFGTQVIGRSENLGDDVYEGIARFNKEGPFPSRILLYDTELESIKQILLAYEWKESLFMHFPKIETLEKEVSIKAVAIGGGGEAANSLALKQEVSTKDFGFLQGEDVIEEEEEKKKEIKPIKEEIVEGKPEKLKKKFSLPKLSLPEIKIKIPHFKLPSRLPKVSLKNRLSLVIGLVIFFLFILGGVATAAYWYYPKAQVTIFVEPKPLPKEVEVNVDPGLTLVDFDKKQIPGEAVEIKIEGTREGEATGEKLVGDRAKGEVTLHNFTLSSKSFKKGTVIIGPDNSEFSLDVDVVVASASASLDENWDEVTTPGKTKVTVNATKIGPEYNLASGSEFQIKEHSSSSYRAKNEKAFSGGTSRKVRVVSVEDQEDLLNELTVELENKTKEELKNAAPEGKKILEKGVLTSVTNQEFDKAVGAETERFKLDLGMQVKALAYSNSDLDNLLEKIISDSIPAGFVSQEIETNIGEGEIKEEGNAIFKIHLEADLVPILDLEEIKKNLTGKYPEVGEEYLRSLPSFVKAKIVITPNLPSRLRVFPRFAKNIDIKIETQE